IGDMKLNRVGTDSSRSLANINGFRIEFTLTAGNAITIEVDSRTALGTYPLDVGDFGAPYQYRCRYRSSLTGARSNYSPASFGGVSPFREAVLVTVGTVINKPTEADKIDIERFGGTLTNWTYVGSIDFSGAPFTDQVTDDVAAANAALS